MEQTIDMDSVDWKIGHMSGVALAKVDATLNEEEVNEEGLIAFGAMAISVVLNRNVYIAGHMAGYKNYLGGLV